ncbi:hypothetical protein [Rhodoblastus sp.]|uniref:hypothetical protein n=1 Tax=Rhodoblastus sp. TaxID=1962975 RepID=UPI003F955C3C
MRRIFPAEALALTLLVAGCNANRAPPVVELAPLTTPAYVRVTPAESHLPQSGGCAGDIAQFRAVQDNDLATGHIEKGVYGQIQGELAEADQACGQGDTLRAKGLLRATKTRHGYPEG